VCIPAGIKSFLSHSCGFLRIPEDSFLIPVDS
jgi:hypothetical protein